MKKDQRLEKLLVERFDKLETKMDRVLEEKIPLLEKEIAVTQVRAGIISTGITLVGGALAMAFTWAKK